MKHYSSNSYIKAAHGFPSDNIEHSLKGEDWYKDYLKAIVTQYYTDHCAISFSDRDTMLEDRQFGSGTQPIGIYKKRFGEDKDSVDGPGSVAVSGSAQNDEAREGFMNVDWRILPVASKFKYVLMGFFGKYAHDISVDAIDPMAEEERKSMKYASVVQSMFREIEKAIEKFQGIDQVAGEDQWLPRNIQEADLFQQLGGYKLSTELVMETCLKQSFTVDSKWDKKDKLLVINDLIDHSKAASKSYICDVTGRVRQKYVDIMNTVYPWTRSKTEHPKFAGEFTTATIEELRLSGCFTEDELCQIHNDVAKMRGMTRFYDVNEARREDGSFAYDNFTVEIFDGEWTAPYIEYKTRRRRSDGSYGVFPPDRDSEGKAKLYDTPKRKTWKVNTSVVYKGKLILGTDEVYDYGLAENIIKDGSRAMLNYNFVYIDGESITRRCKPIYNQIQMDWLSFQNARAKAAPDGIAVEMGSLQNVTMGDRTLKPLEILRIRRKTGDFIYKATPIFSQGNYSQSRPITPIDGGAGKATEDFVRSMEANLELLREFSGVTQPASASDVNPRAGLGISKMQLQSTDNALFPVLNSYESLLEDTGEKTYRLIQNVFKAYPDYKDNPYYGIVNRTGIQIFNNLRSFCRTSFGFKISARPTDEEVQSILNMAMESVRAAKEGGEGITPHDFFIIQRLAFTGNIKRAEVEIGLREAQRREERFQQQQQIEEQRAEQMRQQQIEAREAELDKMREEADIEVEKQRKMLQDEADIQLERERRAADQNLEKYKKFREAGFEDALIKEKV